MSAENPEKMANALYEIIMDHQAEVEAALKTTPDWSVATDQFNDLFKHMANPSDSLWSKAIIDELHITYYKARDEDTKCKNITERTLKAIPEAKANVVKLIFLQIASTCRIFNASHKVNFEPLEIPVGIDTVPLVPAKKKGFFTYSHQVPSLYQKISLTFDYWVPKFLDWTQEIREKGYKDWKGQASFQHQSCTDFMRIALQFISDPGKNLPVCKPEVRQALLNNIFDDHFIWIKKSARREDIAANNKALYYHLNRAAVETGLKIPAEAWSRILELKPIKAIIK